MCRLMLASAAMAMLLAAVPLQGAITGGGGDRQVGEQSGNLSPATPDVSTKVEAIERANTPKSVADGLYMSGQFTYVLQGGVASITLQRVNNESFSRTTGTLQLSLWATTYEPQRGAGITGYRLATFPSLGVLPPRTYFEDIARSANYVPPPNGTYWLVLVLAEYNPAGCPSNSDGYCLEDTFTSFSQVRWGSAQPTFNYTDLWWTASESGWGISLVQHASNIIFAAWFTYDEFGIPMWYVAPACILVGDYCTGTLYETTGSPFSQPFNPALVTVRPVGTLSLTFSGYGNASMRYNVRGVIRTKAITRQPF